MEESWHRYEKEWERNAAIHQPTSASSIYGDDFDMWGPYYATDGVMPTNISSGGIFHSKVQSTPWLSVDLQEALRISFIRVFNRADKNGERFHDVAVEVSLGGVLYEQKGFFKGPGVTNQVVEILCDHPTIGRYVRIKIISGVGNYLHINEIEIYTIS
ncbi:fucolectin-6-like [Saccostrea echinata]|uniref:fucolectin-6-like n=1 Tax=Saccostrea echinata TaxID=191078 RepID=UPI002A80A63B|nr:fucolectin-6-like [Saccostrea echinata]